MQTFIVFGKVAAQDSLTYYAVRAVNRKDALGIWADGNGATPAEKKKAKVVPAPLELLADIKDGELRFIGEEGDE